MIEILIVGIVAVVIFILYLISKTMERIIWLEDDKRELEEKIKALEDKIKELEMNKMSIQGTLDINDIDFFNR